MFVFASALSSLIANPLISIQIWHIERFGLRFAQPTEDGICYDQRARYRLLPNIDSDDIVHPLNVVTTNCPSTKAADGFCNLTTTTTLHNDPPKDY